MSTGFPTVCLFAEIQTATSRRPPIQDDLYVQEVFGTGDAELVFVGHVHWAQNRQLENLRVINPGPVGPNLFASYVMLSAKSDGYDIEFRLVDYDRSAVIAELKRLRHPGAKFIIKSM